MRRCCSPSPRSRRAAESARPHLRRPPRRGRRGPRPPPTPHPAPFHVTLPPRLKDRISQHGTAIRLGSFFPILPWVPGSGWALDPPTRVPAETSTSPAADFDATIQAPSGLGVVATGVQVSPHH